MDTDQIFALGFGNTKKTFTNQGISFISKKKSQCIQNIPPAPRRINYYYTKDIEE